MNANYATDLLTGVTGTGSPMRLRQAGWRDCWRLWRWRNHPTTRPMMRNMAPVGLGAHVCWFAAAMRQPERVVYIALVDGRPVGSGRLDFSGIGRVAEFDVVVAPRWRGRGYGRQMIELMVAGAEAMGATTLIADVRLINTASLVAFQRAGFRAPRPAIAEFVRLVRLCG